MPSEFLPLAHYWRRILRVGNGDAPGAALISSSRPLCPNRRATWPVPPRNGTAEWAPSFDAHLCPQSVQGEFTLPWDSKWNWKSPRGSLTRNLQKISSAWKSRDYRTLALLAAVSLGALSAGNELLTALGHGGSTPPLFDAGSARRTFAFADHSVLPPKASRCGGRSNDWPTQGTPGV